MAPRAGGDTQVSPVHCRMKRAMSLGVLNTDAPQAGSVQVRW